MFAEVNRYFLNYREGSFKDPEGKNVSFAKLTVCDKEGSVESFSVLPDDRHNMLLACEELNLFDTVSVSLEIRGSGKYMKAYAESIHGREV